MAEVSRSKGGGREGRPHERGGHAWLLSLRIQLLPSARPSTMTLWRYSLLAVSLVSLSFFLRDNRSKRLEYSVSLVSSRNWEGLLANTSAGRKYVQLCKHASITIEVLRRGHLKIQERVKKRYSPSLEYGQDFHRVREEEGILRVERALPRPSRRPRCHSPHLRRRCSYHPPFRDRLKPEDDSSHMHSICSGEGHAQVLGSTFSPCASDRLEQRGRWLWGNVWPELSKERPLELRHQVSFLQDKTARSSAAVPEASTGQAEPGALPAGNGGEIRPGQGGAGRFLLCRSLGPSHKHSTPNWRAPLPRPQGPPPLPAPRVFS